MPLPEGYLPREGDVVTIHAEVKYDVDAGNSTIHMFPVGARYRDFALPLDKIVGLERRRWRDDEDVTSAEDEPDFGKIVGIHGDHVVVMLDPSSARYLRCMGHLRVFHCNELLPWPGPKKADDEVVEAAPPPSPAPSEDDEEVQF